MEAGKVQDGQDQELLDMQRRKSRPKVVVEEYLHDDDAEGSSSEEIEAAVITVEQKQESITGQTGSDAQPKLVKLKTHIEIEDFGELTDDKTKHVGLKEISPLERHFSSEPTSADEKQ